MILLLRGLHQYLIGLLSRQLIRLHGTFYHQELARVALLASTTHEPSLALGLRLHLLCGFLNRSEYQRLLVLGTAIL